MPNGILEESQKMRHLALFNPRGSVVSQKIKSFSIWGEQQLTGRRRFLNQAGLRYDFFTQKLGISLYWTPRYYLIELLGAAQKNLITQMRNGGVGVARR